MSAAKRSIVSLERAAAAGDSCAKQLLAQTQSPRAADTAEGPTPKGDTLEAPSTLQPVGAQVDLDPIKRMRMEMGTSPIEFAAEHLEDARPELIEALKWLDHPDTRDLHVALGEVVNGLDALRSKLPERGQS